MSLVDQIKQALIKAVDRAGNQSRLQKKTGVHQSGINSFLNGKRDIANMTMYTLEKLFPDLKVFFFRDEYPTTNNSPQESYPADLSAIERKIIRAVREMKEDAQLEVLEHAAVLRERQPKNNRDEQQLAG